MRHSNITTGVSFLLFTSCFEEQNNKGDNFICPKSTLNKVLSIIK